MAPRRLCGSPLASGILDEATVNLLERGGCAECGSSALTVRLSGEQESASQPALPREWGRDATLVPDAAAEAHQHHETDACRRLPLASSHEAPSTVTQASEVPDCQTILDGLLHGNYAGEQDQSVLEEISNALLFRGECPEIHRKHKIGGVRV